MVKRRRAGGVPHFKRLRLEHLENRWTLSVGLPLAGPPLKSDLPAIVHAAAIPAPPFSLVVSPATPVPAAQGTPFNATVATFTVSPSSATTQASQFSALINWGDGTTPSVGVITGSVGSTTFSVVGSHTYSANGVFRITVTVTSASQTQSDASYAVQTNLVANTAAANAVTTDPNLNDPWGIAAGPTGPFFVANHGSGTVTTYTASGTPQLAAITIPNPGGGTSSPTGIVFNNTSAFVTNSGNPSTFLVATENGSIAAWDSTMSMAAQTVVTEPGADFTGLAMGSIGSANYLYAANLTTGMIEVFNGGFVRVQTNPLAPNAFADPVLALQQHGFVPFNIQNISGQLYVTYMLQTPALDNPLPGDPFYPFRNERGFVDVFTTSGAFVRSIPLTPPAVPPGLNSPWGVALAPANFGALGGDLLVGNAGDGTIDAFASSGSFLGQLASLPKGLPFTSAGLRALSFGNGGGATSAGGFNDLFFTSDANGGLFASLTSGTAATVKRSSNLTGVPQTLTATQFAAPPTPFVVCKARQRGDHRHSGQLQCYD